MLVPWRPSKFPKFLTCIGFPPKRFDRFERLERFELLECLELFLELPHQPYDLAQDAELSLGDRDRGIFFILRLEGNGAVLFIETL